MNSPLQRQEARMAEQVQEQMKGDYSCEIMAFVVLVILSELSHFWYIIIAICIGMIFRGTIFLFGQLVQAAACAFPRRHGVRQSIPSKMEDSLPQVFQPSKIRQSVDC
jgi:hypothetical protein